MAERSLAEETHRNKCANRAADILIELARVPAMRQKQFRDEMCKLVLREHKAIVVRRGKRSRAFIRLEQNIRAAYIAVQHITKEERAYLDATTDKWAEGALPPDEFFRAALFLMARSCAAMSGKSPYMIARGGRGRRRGDIKDYPFKLFICSLARWVLRSGGRLSLDVKNQSGSWIKALDLLRPQLPNGFIPGALPLTSIERYIAEAKEDYAQHPVWDDWHPFEDVSNNGSEALP